MSTVEQGPASNGLVNRIKNILFTPKEEWDVIDAEPATIQGLYKSYVFILAAIGPVANLIGSELFGRGFFGFSYRPPLIGAIVGAIVDYLLSLVLVYVLALVIDALAPNFGAERNKVQSFKVAVYSWTAVWVAGIFFLLPPVSGLYIIGIYSCYLLYLGLPKLMKVPDDKVMTYTIVALVVAVLCFAVIRAVSYEVTGMGAMSGGYARNSAPGGVISVNGTSVDLGKLNAASQQMKAAAEQMQASANGKATVQAVPADTLKGLLPTALPAGYNRTELSAESGGVGGLQGSSAEGEYTKGDAHITLKVTDMAAAGAIATLGGAFGVQSEKETATGYEKVHMVGGRMTDEEWDNSSKSGKYGVMVGSRFMVEAEGTGADMNDLKAAVGAIGVDHLESLAKG